MSDIFSEKVDIPSGEVLRPVNSEEFENVVRNRRSVRIYDGSPVPESVVRKCLELALLAPNSSNLQCWQFYWVRSPDKKQKLVDLCLGQNAARTAAELIVCAGRIDNIQEQGRQMLRHFDASGIKLPKVVHDYYSKLVPIAYATGPLSVLAPFKWLALTITGFFRPTPREPLGNGDLRIWAAKSSALACQNLMLAFSAHGFDTCPMEGLDSLRVKKLLGLPRSSVITMAISVGKRKAEGVYGPRVRFPSEQFIHEV